MLDMYVLTMKHLCGIFLGTNVSFLAEISEQSAFLQAKIPVCCLETRIKTRAYVLQSSTENYYVWH